LHHKVQKFSSGTGSPGWSQKKGHKMLVVISTKGLSKYEPAISSFNRSTHNAFKNCV